MDKPVKVEIEIRVSEEDGYARATIAQAGGSQTVDPSAALQVITEEVRRAERKALATVAELLERRQDEKDSADRVSRSV